MEFEHFPTPNHIKIDTDSFEERIVAGMLGLLAKPEIKTIVIEMPSAPEKSSQIINALHGAGFTETIQGNALNERGNRYFIRNPI